jgi:hypothetical protein
MHSDLMGQMVSMEHSARLQAARRNERYDQAEESVTDPARKQRLIRLLGCVVHRRPAAAARPATMGTAAGRA